jgi:hypothetical protein
MLFSLKLNNCFFGRSAAALESQTSSMNVYWSNFFSNGAVKERK